MKPVFSMPGKIVTLLSNQTYQIDPEIDHGQGTVMTSDGYPVSWSRRPTEHNIISVTFESMFYDPDYLSLLEFFRTWAKWRKNGFTYTDPMGTAHSVHYHSESFKFERFAPNIGRCSFTLLEVV